MTSKKAQRLIELVRGKTVLKEAPTRRDVILAIYRIDIDDPNTEDYTKYSLRRKLNGLLRNVRDREEKQAVDPYGLHNYNENQFHMIQDEETKKWYCVHVIERINGNYLLKWNKRMEKYDETSRRREEKRMRIVRLSNEQRETNLEQNKKDIWSERYLKHFCTHKHIRACIRKLKKDGSITGKYKPNMKGIRYVFADNAGEVGYVNEHFWAKSSGKAYQDADSVIKEMLKEIILCDFNKMDYHLPEAQKIDFLNVGLGDPFRGKA